MDKQEGGGMGYGRFAAMLATSPPGNGFADAHRHPAGGPMRQSVQ
jgi:hypothetical protein